METLEIHSKDFLVKWVNAPDKAVIDWQVKPLKKSINFAIYKRNELEIPSDESTDPKSTGSSSNSSRLRSSSVASVNQFTESFRTKSRLSTFSSLTSNSDLTLVKDYNKLIAEELVHGKFDVAGGGVYAFVFDNLFSKTTAKKVLFSSKIVTSPKASAVSFDNDGTVLRPKNGELLQSVLLKKRRKKLQGFTKRFFILNFKYGTLSYFRVDDNKLRGQMPIRHSVVSANSKTREIIIDSGMEVWDLKALNEEDFQVWVKAFNEVKKAETPALLSDDEDLTNDDIVERLQNISFKLSQVKGADVSGISQDVSELIEQLKPRGDALSVFSSNEFYDAKEYLDVMNSGVVLIGPLGIDDALSSSSDEGEDDGDSSSSDDDDSDDQAFDNTEVFSTVDNDNNLWPLPHEPIERDSDIPEADHEPPSILAFVRKNVGKDLSSIAMPVDMNEPLTILQKYAEMVEYCDIINKAVEAGSTEERVLRVAAFAVSYLSSVRAKLRNSRKPFNPLLGETFELVREDFGVRLISEKVSHRPPVFAIFVESNDWFLSFSPAPSQKFWGKNAEITTKGVAKLTIKSSGEVYTWNQPTSMLKNIIAGEKYTEPSSPITVKSSTGYKAVVEFAKGGMFSGRSEDLVINAFDAKKKKTSYSVSGKWTESLTLKTNTTEKQIWTAGRLLPNAEKKFGFTEFAGTLNKITELEDGYLAPTDSRLRPDMSSYEKGDLEKAEQLKNSLEQAQRERRKELEDSGKEYQPLFFHHVGEDGADLGEWVYTTGENSYWNRRKNKNWEGLPKLW